jgi:uncharacterized protein YPO0396
MKITNYGEHMSNDTKVAILENTMNHIYEDVRRVENRVHRVENRLASMDQRLGSLEHIVDTKFAAIDKKFDAVDRQFDAVEQRFSTIDNRLWSNFLWLVGLLLGSVSGLAGLMAHGFHWI